jgi:tRNA pseudouridine55 synthase
MMPLSNEVSGLFLLNKPIGKTSNDCLQIIKKSIPRKTKIGYSGTLDRAASGVLPIGIGAGTKLLGKFTECNKGYYFTIIWGVHTDTYDLTGKTIATNQKRPNLESIFQGIEYFLECYTIQTTPLYSSVKIKSVPAYKYALGNKTVILPKRVVTIYEFKLIKQENDRADFYVLCSKGTYIRSLAVDFARHLSCIGSVMKLIRIRVGDYTLKDTVRLSADFSNKEIICYLEKIAKR